MTKLEADIFNTILDHEGITLDKCHPSMLRIFESNAITGAKITRIYIESLVDFCEREDVEDSHFRQFAERWAKENLV